MSDNDTEETQEYRLLRGTYRPEGAEERITPEDDDPVVELTERQRDVYAPSKFEPVTGSE